MLATIIECHSMIAGDGADGFIIGDIKRIILMPVIEDVIRDIQQMLDTCRRDKTVPLVQVAIDEILR